MTRGLSAISPFVIEHGYRAFFALGLVWANNSARSV